MYEYEQNPRGTFNTLYIYSKHCYMYEYERKASYSAFKTVNLIQLIVDD